MSSWDYLAALGYISSISFVDKEDLKNFIHSAEYQSMGNVDKNKVLGKRMASALPFSLSSETGILKYLMIQFIFRFDGLSDELRKSIEKTLI